MPEIPQSAIMAASIAIERELMSGKDYSMAQDSDEALARVALEAAWPHLAGAVAKAILAHMEARGPRRSLTDAGERERIWRRDMHIAARVAGTALFTEDELKQAAADAIERGAIACAHTDDYPDTGAAENGL